MYGVDNYIYLPAYFVVTKKYHWKAKALSRLLNWVTASCKCCDRQEFRPLAGRYIGVFIYGRIRVNSRELFALSISRIAAVHVQVVVEHTYLGRGLARRLASDMLCAAKHCLLST